RRDYQLKDGLSHVVLGRPGGIYNATVAAMASDAVGPEKLHAIMLSYRYTSEPSLRHAWDWSARLGVPYYILAICNPIDRAPAEVQPIFANRPVDAEEENIQSRIRGTILMAVSNKLGSMLLTTGNKSEMGVGYATIYGDMNGGYNPLKDMFKMDVY